ncbi:MAG: hypothetical protein WDN46_07740 [Methylocella sp.]
MSQTTHALDRCHLALKVGALATRLVKAADKISARCDDGLCESVLVLHADELCEDVEGAKIAGAPVRSNKPGELLRLDFDLHDKELLPVFKQACRMALEPFVEGVGQISVDDAPEGVVIPGSMVGKYNLSNPLPPLFRRPKLPGFPSAEKPHDQGVPSPRADH